jgi:phage tail sheath protein FI
MNFTLSPGVLTQEFDETTGVPAVSTSIAAFAGPFRWGPIGEAVLVTSESDLVKRFLSPTNYNPETFFVAADFLSYAGGLYVSRAANTTDVSNGVLTAVANVSSNVANLSSFVVLNSDDYLTHNFASADSDIVYCAKYPGAAGDSLKVSVCDSQNAFSSNISVANVTFVVGSNTANLAFSTNAAANSAWSQLIDGDLIQVGNSTIGTQYLQISSLGSAPTGNVLSLSFYQRYTLSSNFNSVTSVTRKWQYYNSVSGSPATSAWQKASGNASAVDELHVVVVDENGLFSGTPGSILEVFDSLSRATDAQNPDGTTNYYKNVINQGSNYLWWTNDRSGVASNTAVNIASVDTQPLSISLNSGQDGHGEGTIDFASLANAWNVFTDASTYDVSLVPVGKNQGGTGGEQLVNYINDNITTVRKDCVSFVSPNYSDVVNNSGNEATSIVTFRNLIESTSYSSMDSGYAYRYDKYNDIYRYVPMCGGSAGIYARTDLLRAAWFAGAGYNRGKYKNVVKLAYNPSTQAERDVLFQNDVNPVVTEKGQGTILLGDKTLLGQTSDFDAVNVRRLFIILEKAISQMAKFSLFEFNNEITRGNFVSAVRPFLRNIQGLQGITDFYVQCDSTNNTNDVVQARQFVGSIYVKPALAIRFIALNFVAVRNSVQFTELLNVSF